MPPSVNRIVNRRHFTAASILALVSWSVCACDDGLPTRTRPAVPPQEPTNVLAGLANFRTWDGGDFILCTGNDPSGAGFELILRRDGDRLIETYRGRSERAQQFATILQMNGQTVVADVDFPTVGAKLTEPVPAYYRSRMLDASGIPSAAIEFELGPAKLYMGSSRALDFGVAFRIEAPNSSVWYVAEGSSPPVRLFEKPKLDVFGSAGSVVAVASPADESATIRQWSIRSRSDDGSWGEGRQGEIPDAREPITLWRGRFLSKDRVIPRERFYSGGDNFIYIGEDPVQIAGSSAEIIGIRSDDGADVFLVQSVGGVYHLINADGRIVDMLAIGWPAGGREAVRTPHGRLGFVEWSTEADRIVARFITVKDGKIVKSTASLTSADDGVPTSDQD
jgi:hypothetical protein